MAKSDELESLINQGRKHGVRKRAILLAAARLFVERGYVDTGIDDIGAAAGISGPAVYRHFPGKQAILLALVELSVERLREGTQAILADRERDPRESLSALVDWFARSSVENPDLNLILQGELLGLPVGDQRRLTRQIRQVREEWVGLLLEARPELSDLAARIAVTSVMGMVTPVLAARLSGDVRTLSVHLKAQMLAVLHVRIEEG
ncbi:DNA-binding transcriptional regulator, AcrR family [Sinosporangium album]|uniref:DNA-binding transcriptional regulator, AcrR family n=1 Tax=Sinosporangium album TaxID=504805 RepID=A0A1G8KNY9_9ACTN|nr:TetR/AcrR family transcriptional regulator [Sinosporangium album]SDI45096.1 DNA-binding transcriptional regulator, AcrR family [Sinosporangium album]